MKFQMNRLGRSPLLAVSILLCGLGLAGCDEHVEIIRDRNIPVLKHQTWAWRPAPVRKEAKNERPVVSRDVIGGRETVVKENDPANEIVRNELRTAIERHLTEKGLTQVSDPAAADFLVDYHFAMRRHNARINFIRQPVLLYPALHTIHIPAILAAKVCVLKAESALVTIG